MWSPGGRFSRRVSEEVSEEVDRASAAFDWLTGADEDMTVEAQLEARDAGSRSPRVDTAFLVLLRCAAGKFPARITNLSATGFRLEAPRQLEAGWEVTLEAPKLRPVKCVIRWASGKEAGGVFLDSVSL